MNKSPFSPLSLSLSTPKRRIGFCLIVVGPKEFVASLLRSGMSLLDVLISLHTRGLAGRAQCLLPSIEVTSKTIYWQGTLTPGKKHVIVSVVSIHNNNTTHETQHNGGGEKISWLDGGFFLSMYGSKIQQPVEEIVLHNKFFNEIFFSIIF